MDAQSNCHEAAAHHFELAAQHHRLAAERAAGGDELAAAHLTHVANTLAARAYRYALHAARRTKASPAGDIDAD